MSAAASVERVGIAHVSVPLPERIASGIHVIDSVECVTVELHARGEVGGGYAFCFSAGEAAAIEALARELAPAVHGAAVHRVRGVWAELWRRTNFVGHAGPPLMALSALDMALWDLHARVLGAPLHRLLGAVRDEVEVYYAAGWLTLSTDELVAQALAAKEAGYRSYKLRVGSRDWRGDVARVAAVREAVGPELRLMVDVNQAWDVATAIRAGRALQEHDLAWIEEPVDAQDVAGCARVAAALDAPVAAGETVWGPNGLVELVRAGAVDVLQPDLMRCGGITGFLRAAEVAEAANVPVVSHLYTPWSAHLMATTSRSDLVEYIPGWFDALFAQAPAIERGRIVLGEAPGTGVVFAGAAS